MSRYVEDYRCPTCIGVQPEQVPQGEVNKCLRRMLEDAAFKHDFEDCKADFAQDIEKKGEEYKNWLKRFGSAAKAAEKVCEAGFHNLCPVIQDNGTKKKLMVN